MTINIIRQDGIRIPIDSESFAPTIERLEGVGASMPDNIFLLKVGTSGYVAYYTSKEDAEAALQEILDEGDDCDLSECFDEYGKLASEFLEMTDKDFNFRKAVEVRGLTALQYLNATTNRFNRS